MKNLVGIRTQIAAVLEAVVIILTKVFPATRDILTPEVENAIVTIIGVAIVFFGSNKIQRLT